MIDKNEAPEGYEAVLGAKGCYGCAFANGWCSTEYARQCVSGNRKDGCDVIFKEKGAKMKKIYSAVDADEARHLIVKEVYCGDTVEKIKRKDRICVLEKINDEACTYRFSTCAGIPYLLIQEAEQPFDGEPVGIRE